MRNLHNRILAILIIALTFPFHLTSQDNTDFELSYEVYKIYPPRSVTRAELNEASSLADLNKQYKTSWVEEYKSVEIMASHNGQMKKVVSKNDILTEEQKNLIDNADFGSDISVEVNYIPDNGFRQKDISNYAFSFTVDPESDAKYPGGEQQLQQYLRVNAMDKMPAGSFHEHGLTVIKFTVDEKGNVSETHVFETSQHEDVDEILLETVRNMPKWDPAHYSNGMKVKQDFALTVGDMNSCVVNLVNIRRMPEEE